MVLIQPVAAVIGAGPAGLMAAEHLALAGVKVVILDSMAAPGRKFLMAGRGGLNITHSEPFEQFVGRYGRAAAWLRPALSAFPPDALRTWCLGLGEPTFIGSSGRVFPTSFRATPLLRAWLVRLASLGVEFRPKHVWSGWDKTGDPVFSTADGEIRVPADVTILALGGASWPRLGSTGSWVSVLAERGVEIAALGPANCGFTVAWSPFFSDRFGGIPLKNVQVSCGSARARGDAMITTGGIEGGPIYAVGSDIRSEIENLGQARVEIDLHPDLTVEALSLRLARARKGDSIASTLRKVGLSPIAVALLREVSVAVTAETIKALPLTLLSPTDIDRAISTAGGVRECAVTGDFGLKALPGVFVAGEMLDWEAPTGGYLLQACFATGHAAAAGALHLLGRGSATRGDR